MRCKECGGKARDLFEAYRANGETVFVCEFCRDHYCSLCKSCNSYIFNGRCERLDNCIHCKMIKGKL